MHSRYLKRASVAFLRKQQNQQEAQLSRGTTRCVVSVEILPIATQQCSTTSPEQIEVMKLEG